MVRLDAQTSWHFRFHKPRSRRKRMAIGIGKPVDERLCRFSVRLLLDPLDTPAGLPEAVAWLSERDIIALLPIDLIRGPDVGDLACRERRLHGLDLIEQA